MAGLYFVFAWLLFRINAAGIEVVVDGLSADVSPAVQGAWVALLVLVLVLVSVALFLVFFSFSWLSIGLLSLTALSMGGLILAPLFMPFLLPLALVLSLAAIIYRR